MPEICLTRCARHFTLFVHLEVMNTMSSMRIFTTDPSRSAGRRTRAWHSRAGRGAALPAGCLLLLACLPARTVCSQDPVQYFRQNCASCHTIGGGRLTGPDLKDVTTRQSRQWLVAFVQDPLGVLASGDPYALQLKDAARGAVMPTMPGMTRELAGALLDLIERESALA